MTGALRPVPAAFGVSLWRLRRDRGWSLRQAGRAAGVSPMTVARAEQGGNVGLAQALGLAGAYGVSLGALLGPQPHAAAVAGR